MCVYVLFESSDIIIKIGLYYSDIHQPVWLKIKKKNKKKKLGGRMMVNNHNIYHFQYIYLIFIKIKLHFHLFFFCLIYKWWWWWWWRWWLYKMKGQTEHFPVQINVAHHNIFDVFLTLYFFVVVVAAAAAVLAFNEILIYGPNIYERWQEKKIK